MTAADKSRNELRRLVQEWAEEMGVRPARVQIQRMSRKWASCSTSGRVCFSVELLGQPAAFREAVVVHELLHLRVRNHGRLFRALMNAYLPGRAAAAGAALGICGAPRATRGRRGPAGAGSCRLKRPQL
ncbi:MAG TPA: M48 family metallopeptidase [Terriglobales bacterium]|nr:M48 family metallopeptidase [Terriglobales bacterium]